MKRKLIVENAAGFPETVLVEGTDIDVEFEHNGRKAVATFEIDGGWEVLKGSYHFPPEYEDISVDFVGAAYLDGEGEKIADSEIYPDLVLELTDKAMDQYEPVKPEKYYPEEDM
jgi:hypothetical protein